MKTVDLFIEYINRGWSVFPVCYPIDNRNCLHHGKCKVPGKTPLVSWLPYQKQIATKDDVANWIKQFGENTNIAIVTGAISNLVVLDADGYDAVNYIENHDFPDCPVVLTGKPGGAHYYINHPGHEIHNFAGKVDKLDFRGDGGYVLAAGSQHANGVKYRWLGDTKDLPLPDMPNWMEELFKERESVSHGPGWIGKTLDELREGNRNESLHAIAGWLRRYGATNADSIALLQPHAARVGLSYKELEALVASAGKYPVEYKPKNVKLILDENGKYKWVKDE